MEIDATKNVNAEESLVAGSTTLNGHHEKEKDQKSLVASEMTSADYYFDSYAHFGESRFE